MCFRNKSTSKNKKILSYRKKIFDIYNQRLNNIKLIKLPKSEKHIIPAYHLYIINIFF